MAEGAQAAKPSALSSYFHVGFKAEDKANAPAGKPPSAGTAAGHPPAASHAGSASLTAAASANGAAASTAGGAPSTAGTALTQQGAKGGLGIKPSSAGVEAALQAVLNKPEQGIRGLSVAPDESLTKDKVNKDVLEKMRQTFARADADGTGELSPEEFCASFKGILHTEDGSDEGSLKKLFMRIDANSDGSVNWDEFIGFLLLESQGAANLRDLENSISFDPPEDWVPPEGAPHDKLVTHITHAILPNGERYVTCGKDGLVKIWNAKDLKLMRTLQVGKSWVTAAKLLPATNKLAVTSFSRCMKIYDLQTFELCGQIPEIEYAPMAMDVWTPQRHRDVELVVFGDGGGFVRLYELRLNPLEQKTSNDRYLDLVKWRHQHHTDWVTCIKYVEELNTVVAGSLDKTISLTDADDRVGVKVLQGHLKGVSCVDWSPMYKFIVSGSQDRRVMLWNPFSLKPLATLMGHTSSVTAVVVNDRDNQIISLGADKQVKLWDIRNHKCIQTMADREVVPGVEENTLLCAAYDHRRKALVTGALWPKLWRQTITAAASCGHREPVVRVLFNPLFDEAVSADAGGTVSVWFVPTGKLRFRFGNTHPGQQLTALNFDGPKRRLITGAESGEVKVWNFSSGACLCVLRPKTHEEVTSVLTIRGALFKHFVVAGWDRRVTCYEDPGPAAKETFPGRIMAGHKADILDMAVQPNSNQVVSASDDGEVCVWNVESGALRKRMSPPGQAQLPVNEQAIERVLFLSGKLHHLFVTVGADRWLRIWDIATMALVLEHFTGHLLGESVLGLAAHPDNFALATGDAAGFVKVWALANLTGLPARDAENHAAGGVITERALWRAHKGAVTSMDWARIEAGDFLLTSSADKTVSLWSLDGAFVGQFGAHVWLADAPNTWRSTEAFPLDPRDQMELETSSAAPKRGATLDRLTAMCPSMSQHASPRALGEPSSLQSRPGSSVSKLLKPDASRPQSGATGAQQPPQQRLLSASPTRLRSAMGAREGADAARGAAAGAAGALAAPAGSASVSRGAGRASFVDRNLSIKTNGLTDEASSSALQGVAETSPDQVGRVLAAAQQDRLRRVRTMRMKDKPHEFEPGGQYSRPTSGWRSPSARHGAGGAASMSKRSVQDEEAAALARAAAGVEEDGGDSGSEGLASESSESEAHLSDDDIPTSLWLNEFQLVGKATRAPSRPTTRLSHV